jgi:hypothetical protein
MALSSNKILIAGALANTVGAYTQPVVVTGVGVGNATAMLNAKVIPAGWYALLPTANVTIELNAYTGTANAWTTLVANNTAATTLWSDGVNLRANAVSGTQSVTLYGINEGTAATQSSYATS